MMCRHSVDRKSGKEFQAKMRACANARDRTDHGLKVLGMASFYNFFVFWFVVVLHN